MMRTNGTWGVPRVTGTSVHSPSLLANEVPLCCLMVIWEPSAGWNERTRPSAYVYITFTYPKVRRFISIYLSILLILKRICSKYEQEVTFACGATGVGSVDIKRHIRSEKEEAQLGRGHNNCHRPKKPTYICKIPRRLVSLKFYSSFFHSQHYHVNVFVSDAGRPLCKCDGRSHIL